MCNKNDILLVVGYNYNIYISLYVVHTHTRIHAGIHNIQLQLKEVNVVYIIATRNIGILYRMSNKHVPSNTKQHKQIHQANKSIYTYKFNITKWCIRKPTRQQRNEVSCNNLHRKTFCQWPQRTLLLCNLHAQHGTPGILTFALHKPDNTLFKVAD